MSDYAIDMEWVNRTQKKKLNCQYIMINHNICPNCYKSLKHPDAFSNDMVCGHCNEYFDHILNHKLNQDLVTPWSKF